MSTSSTITPLQLTGVSTMSSNLQAILTRAVSIAQIPLKQLQNKDSDVLQENTLLSGLGSAASALGNAVTNLGKIAASGALAASSSDPTNVSVENTGAAFAASHTISDVTSIAAPASATSSGFADSSQTQVSSTGTMSLRFGSGPNDTYTINLGSQNNNLVGLRDAINGLGAGLTASILTTSNGNYLELTANNSGAVQDFSLIDDPGPGRANTPMLTNVVLGSDAVFKLDGIPVDNASNTINNVIPGLTFTFLAKPAGTVNLTLSANGDRLSSAIGSFVSAYNAMRDQVLGQVGPSGGLLSGNFVVRDIQNDLRSLAGYTTSSGSVKSLADLGLTFDNSGRLSFDTTVFNGLSTPQLADALKFFGSTTTGFGAIAQKFTALTDPVTGLIKAEQNGLTQQDQHLQAQMSALTDRINAMQQNLSRQLAAADTMIAGLESQQNMLNSSMAALNYALYGKIVSSTTGS